MQIHQSLLIYSLVDGQLLGLFLGLDHWDQGGLLYINLLFSPLRIKYILFQISESMSFVVTAGIHLLVRQMLTSGSDDCTSTSSCKTMSKCTVGPGQGREGREISLDDAMLTFVTKVSRKGLTSGPAHSLLFPSQMLFSRKLLIPSFVSFYCELTSQLSESSLTSQSQIAPHHSLAMPFSAIFVPLSPCITGQRVCFIYVFFFFYLCRPPLEVLSVVHCSILGTRITALLYGTPLGPPNTFQAVAWEDSWSESQVAGCSVASSVAPAKQGLPAFQLVLQGSLPPSIPWLLYWLELRLRVTIQPSVGEFANSKMT